MVVGDQGSENSCAAWAVGYYDKTIQEYRQHHWDVSRSDRRFSPSWVYNQVCGGRDTGWLTPGRSTSLLFLTGRVT